MEEHDEEEDQEAVAEPLAFHPPGNVLFPGQAEAAPQQAEQLAPAAVAVAVALCALDKGDDHRDAEEQHTQPGEQDVQESQGHIGQLHDPQVVVPAFFHASTSWISMMEAGHSFAHLPQPTHRSGSTCA